MYKSFSFTIAILIFMTVSTTCAGAAQKVALVIGNAEYRDAPLRNPANDANDISKNLKKCGFKVLTYINADLRTMEDAIDQFYRELRDSDTALFYYAGHGIQVHGSNYLIPVGERITSKSDVKYMSVDVGRVMGKMADAQSGLNILILDACRDNPFKRSFRAYTRGLGEMEAPKGSILIYATGPGTVAADGSGRNGLFTSYFLKNMMIPDITIEKVVKLTRKDVYDKTDGSQLPWSSSSLLGDFFFVGGQNVAMYHPVTKKPAAPSPKKRSDAKIFVKTDPSGATVKILNIREKFAQGMKLAPGKYHIQAKLQGYQTKSRWITLDSGQTENLTLSLKPNDEVAEQYQGWKKAIEQRSDAPSQAKKAVQPPPPPPQKAKSDRESIMKAWKEKMNQ